MPLANQLRPFSFVLAVPDIERNTAYFRDALGFTADALIHQPPADKPHGMREFLVATPDGHRLMIGQDLAPRAGR